MSSIKFAKLVKNNVSYVANITKEEWLRKDLSTCIITRDPECRLNTGEVKDLSIPYFCGQEPDCRIVGSKWALERAMENVKNYYSVVGIIEEFSKTLTMLQQKLPFFFGGVLDLYFNVLHGKKVFF